MRECVWVLADRLEQRTFSDVRRMAGNHFQNSRSRVRVLVRSRNDLAIQFYDSNAVVIVCKAVLFGAVVAEVTNEGSSGIGTRSTLS